MGFFGIRIYNFGLDRIILESRNPWNRDRIKIILKSLENFEMLEIGINF